MQRQVALLVEELRIKDARMERLPAQRLPHYPPIERLAILELRAANGWSQAETARRLLVTPLTVASWTQRLDDEGPDALVQTREPVNGSPDVTQFETDPNWLTTREPSREGESHHELTSPVPNAVAIPE